MIAVRVTPGARKVQISLRNDIVQVHVAAPPVDGAATLAAQRLLAQAMGIAPSRLTLQHGAASRDKLFRLD